MKKMMIATALSLALLGALTSCGRTSTPNNSALNGSNANSTTGQVSRRYYKNSMSNHDYMDDGRYTAGSSGQVYGGDGNPVTRDLTQGARDIVRDTGDALGDMGRGVGKAAKDLGRGVGKAAKDLGQGMDKAMKQY